MSTFDEKIDLAIQKVVKMLSFLARCLVCGIPAVLVGPLLDLLTFWHFNLSARATKYVWVGDWSGTRDELNVGGYLWTDGSMIFNMLDILLQLVYIPIVLPMAICTVLIDVFTCNQAKATSTLVPILILPVTSLRGFMVSTSGNHNLSFIVDELWHECTSGLGDGEGTVVQKQDYENQNNLVTATPTDYGRPVPF